VCEISAVENLCSQKSGPKFTKIAIPAIRTNACHRAKFHRAPPIGVRQKRYNFFYIFSIYFGAPWGPHGPTFTNLGPDV